MSGGVNQIMDQGKSGLNAAQKGLATTSHNISNVNTEGYSRQRVELESKTPHGSSKKRIGAGVDVRGVTRANSSFIARRIEAEEMDLGRSASVENIFSQMDNLFQEDAERGISKHISNFFNDVRALSTKPDSAPLRSQVVEAGKAAARKFNEVSGSIEELRTDIDNRIEASVIRVNSLTDKIATLNRRIMNIEGSHGFANDERDQRDLAVRDLAKLVDVQVAEIDNGGLNVTSGRFGALVSGVDRVKIDTVRTDKGPFSSTARVVVKNEFSNKVRDVTEHIKSGALGGYISARDQHLAGILGQLDHLASSFSEQVNSVHRKGFNERGQSNVNFFEIGAGAGASGAIKVKDDLAIDPGKLAVASKANSPGNNQVALRIADLETVKNIDGESSFSDYTSQIVGRVGTIAESAKQDLDTQMALVAQLDNMREEESGVSLDEEAMNMVKFQKAFDANAKLIQVADSMLETVLTLKRF